MKNFKTSHNDHNIQKNTGYSQIDLFQKFLFKIGDDNLLNLNIQFSESSDIDRYDQLSIPKDNSLKFSEWYYGPQNAAEAREAREGVGGRAGEAVPGLRGGA